MNDVVQKLEQTLETSKRVYQELVETNCDGLLKEFSDLCTEYVNTKTKFELMQSLEDYYENYMKNENIISTDECVELEKKKIDLEEEIKEKQRKREESPVTPELFHKLISEGSRILENIKNCTGSNGSADYDELMKLYQQEAENLKNMKGAYEWYNIALQKLSSFTGIVVISPYEFKLLDSYILVVGKELQLTPPDVYIKDLGSDDLKTSMSIIIERLTALQKLKDIAASLKWNIKVNMESPTVVLTPPGHISAVVVLMGFDTYPLLEWGNIDVEEFNNSEDPMKDKLVTYSKHLT